MSVGRAAAASLAAEEGYAPAAALPQRLLHFVLFITVLTSSLAFIEPSPHDGLMLVLLVRASPRAYRSTASSLRSWRC